MVNVIVTTTDGRRPSKKYPTSTSLSAILAEENITPKKGCEVNLNGDAVDFKSLDGTLAAFNVEDETTAYLTITVKTTDS